MVDSSPGEEYATANGVGPDDVTAEIVSSCCVGSKLSGACLHWSSWREAPCDALGVTSDPCPLPTWAPRTRRAQDPVPAPRWTQAVSWSPTVGHALRSPPHRGRPGHRPDEGRRGRALMPGPAGALRTGCLPPLANSPAAARPVHLVPLCRSTNPSDYQILLGYDQLSHPTEHSQQMTVNKIMVHTDYNKLQRMGSDITLLQLHRHVEFSSHILPACLPEPTMWLAPDSCCWISGWGMVTEDVFLPEPFQLQEAEVSVMDNSVCGSFFQPQYPGQPSSSDYTIHDDMLCAGDLVTGKAICRCRELRPREEVYRSNGDSGGPLICPLNGTWFLMGLSSWSLDCLSPVGPSVFTRLPYFTNWISQKKRESPPPDPAVAPPQEMPPALDSMTSQGTVHKPGLCTALLAAHTFLLLLILLGSQ
ncbi:serine protease 40 [Hylobates moloch]|uniref:serine protease 40 n=1 Tax=Hylobates moloch TaxID=81572 RepID=UPI002675A6C1|nr:serine protease 40 [Hylobates moloch]